MEGKKPFLMLYEESVAHFAEPTEEREFYDKDRDVSMIFVKGEKVPLASSASFLTKTRTSTRELRETSDEDPQDCVFSLQQNLYKTQTITKISRENTDSDEDPRNSIFLLQQHLLKTRTITESRKGESSDSDE